MKICRRGHAGPRYKDGKCIPCARAYYAVNKERFNAQATAWAKAHRRRASELTRNWQKANEAHDRARKAAYRKAHPEKGAASKAAWQKSHPARCVAGVARRDAMKRSAPGRGVTSAEWNAVLVGSLGICAYCNARKPLTMDHIEPLSLGGAHDADNVAAACTSCNCSKNDTPLLLWLARQAQLTFLGFGR